MGTDRPNQNKLGKPLCLTEMQKWVHDALGLNYGTCYSTWII